MSIQDKLLEMVREKADPRVSYVDELSDLLELSRDSVYRRVRGETEMSLTEALKICSHYEISVTELDSEFSSAITFNARLVNNSNFNIHSWMSSILQNLDQILKYPGEKEMIYYAKDLPIFYFFKYPQLGAFKIYFWMRTILDESELQHSTFHAESISKDLIQMGARMWDKFKQIPSLEIWADETILSTTLKQITYYFECGYFENPQDALTMMDEFEEFLKDSQEWLRNGSKPNGASLKVYRNDILLGDNSILFKLDGKRITFIPILTMSLLTTSNKRFTNHMEEFIDVMIKRASLISDTGEKERNTYIAKNRRYIKEFRTRIENIGNFTA